MRRYILCKDKYYEGIIQLRPYNETALLYIKKNAEKDNVTISRIEEQKNGIDIYLSSQRFVRNIAQKIKRQFRSEVKISKSIVTRDRLKSRDLYRATALIKFK